MGPTSETTSSLCSLIGEGVGGRVPVFPSEGPIPFQGASALRLESDLRSELTEIEVKHILFGGSE